MKQVNGWFLPDWDTHLAEHMAKNGNEYQKRQRDYALSHVKQHRTAVDVGGNIGTWARDFAEVFDRVHAFEPQADCRQCFEQNLPQELYSNVRLHPQALSPHSGTQEFYTDKISCGNAGLNKQGVLDGPTKDKPNAERLAVRTVETLALDSLELQDVDFIKIDTQGYELEVLKSAERTLEQCKPVLCLELADRTPQEHTEKMRVLAWLTERGYQLLGSCVKEHVFGVK